jgi:hypothetical protein
MSTHSPPTSTSGKKNTSSAPTTTSSSSSSSNSSNGQIKKSRSGSSGVGGMPFPNLGGSSRAAPTASWAPAPATAHVNVAKKKPIKPSNVSSSSSSSSSATTHTSSIASLGGVGATSAAPWSPASGYVATSPTPVDPSSLTPIVWEDQKKPNVITITITNTNDNTINNNSTSSSSSSGGDVDAAPLPKERPAPIVVAERPPSPDLQARTLTHDELYGTSSLSTPTHAATSQSTPPSSSSSSSSYASTGFWSSSVNTSSSSSSAASLSSMIDSEDHTTNTNNGNTTDIATTSGDTHAHLRRSFDENMKPFLKGSTTRHTRTLTDDSDNEHNNTPNKGKGNNNGSRGNDGFDSKQNSDNDALARWIDGDDTPTTANNGSSNDNDVKSMAVVASRFSQLKFDLLVPSTRRLIMEDVVERAATFKVIHFSISISCLPRLTLPYTKQRCSHMTMYMDRKCHDYVFCLMISYYWQLPR